MDPKNQLNQDRITDNVWITRGNNGGQIYNAAKESNDNKTQSPIGTQWALGTLDKVNDLNLQKAVRTYKVENSQLKTVRAWHGHKVEEKWVNVEQGEFLVCIVKVDDFNSPSKNSEIQTYKMSSKDGFLYIPPNFANGDMNLTDDNAI